MSRKLVHWIVSIVFLAVLAIRLEQHFRSPHSTGFMLEVGNFTPPENCEFRIPLVLHVSATRELRLNSEPETPEQLSKRLALILKGRIQPVLYVLPDRDLTMQEFAEILELVRESNSDVSIRLITRGNRKYSCIDYQYGPAA